MQTQLNKQMAALTNSLSDSTTGAVYSNLESTTGLSATDVSGTAAIILSVVPTVLSIGLAVFSGAGRRKQKSVVSGGTASAKKSGRSLQAV